VLSFLYAFNNQLSFYTYMLADPGTIFLFKAASTLIVAIIQVTFIGKTFKGEQWRAMLLQGCGMIVVQYDPCKASSIYTPLAYACMLLSTAVTALTSVANEYFLKNYEISMNLQNLAMYAGGVWMNLVAFLFIPNPNSNQASFGFFDGYSNPLALAVVLANALIGLAITAVYKYADAVTKCIAQDITAVILCIISSIFFGLRASLTTWAGVFVVTFAVYLYMEASQSKPAAAPAVASGSSDQDPAGVGEPKAKKEELIGGVIPKRYLIRLGMMTPIFCFCVLLVMYPDLLSLSGERPDVPAKAPSVLKALGGISEAKDCLRKVSSTAEDLVGKDLDEASARKASLTVAQAIRLCLDGLTGKIDPDVDDV
jgi:UDP-galactose transporter